jgi:hypothetical protein
MRASLLGELSDLFTREAFEKDKHGNPDEAERLWEIAHELHEQFKRTEHVEAGGRVR